MTLATALHVMELRGYRGWQVLLTEEAVVLESLARTRVWTPGVQPAAVHTANLPETLQNESLPAPHPNCRCGYNAYYRPDIERFNLMATAYLRVAGVIRASGIVEMHEAGFRAQYAEILAIAPPRSDGRFDKTQEVIIKPSLLKVIADYYNVPWFETWNELVKEFPPTHEVEKRPRREARDPSELHRRKLQQAAWRARACSGLFHYEKGDT